MLVRTRTATAETPPAARTDRRRGEAGIARPDHGRGWTSRDLMSGAVWPRSARTDWPLTRDRGSGTEAVWPRSARNDWPPTRDRGSGRFGAGRRLRPRRQISVSIWTATELQVSCYQERLASVLEPQSEFLIATRTHHRKDAVMACSCDSCSSPRIIKTRTALFWRWRAQSRERLPTESSRHRSAPRTAASRWPADGDAGDRSSPTGDEALTGSGSSVAVASERKPRHALPPTGTAYRGVSGTGYPAPLTTRPGAVR